MKKKIKARKKRTPAKRLAGKRKVKKTKARKTTIHPSGKDVSVSPAQARAYRLAKRTA